MDKIYLDNGATTKTDTVVVKEMAKYFSEEYGNASSSHSMGAEAKEAIERARGVIAESIGAKKEEIVFTSGGTESNNFAIKGVMFANRERGDHVITTRIDHDCVLNSCKWLEKNGFRVTYLDVDNEGFVDPDELEKAITQKTILVSIIHGNNEIGTIQDMEKLGAVCRKHRVYFHTDACQSYTKAMLDVNRFNLDLVTLNAHKIHGPKGVGALYVRKGTKITPWQHGGGHEFGLRSGTENVTGIVGFARAVELAPDKKTIERIAGLRDRLVEGVLRDVRDVRLNGPRGEKRLCNNANLSFRFVEGESLVALLDSKGISGSTGSACSSHTLEPSHVLIAIGRSVEEAHGSLRLTLSRYTTEEEIDYTIKVIPGVIDRLRSISPLMGRG